MVFKIMAFKINLKRTPIVVQSLYI